ncbi:CocE/NonD family hydrolase [Sphingomonas sp.]|uniref:CocE/NonD family hydrolase n=1 Tax=Sphingomonas sp. TaxID=28214 RepID=UPI003B0057A7
MPTKVLAVAALLVISCSAEAQVAQVSPVQLGSDIPKDWQEPTSNQDFVKREVMIPMRDGVKLHTVIVLPRGSASAPMLLERTPYDASSFLSGNSPRLRDRLLPGDRIWADNAYIMVAQDMRGKYGSEGTYVMTRPPIGPLNPTKTDDTTDAYDTIDWLVKHVPESNGRVGMIGSSYDGWAVVMALLHPHPALKVAAPESPMIDGWMGDDWFQYGAFRQKMFDYFAEQTSAKGAGSAVSRAGRDDYQEMLDAGSAGAYAKAHGIDRLPWWQRLSTHPAYDALWQGQALDKILAAHPSSVPTMWLQGLWDQEDIYGAVHSWEALKAKGMAATNHLAMGPWYHSQVNGRGDVLGPLKWSGDTAAWFRREVLAPFFDTYLRDRKSAQPTPHVILYNPAEDRWDKFADWPGAGPDALTPMYLQPGGGLARNRPAMGRDSYVSDPSKPVPFEQLPVRMGDHASWSTWLVQDQRFVSTRPDVLSYQTPILKATVRVQGAPFAEIFLSTTGSDTDVIVKIIDVYPASNADAPELAGYQLPVSLAIFRGRYRQSLEHPTAIPQGLIQKYKFRLPTLNYTFKPGHRMMVQVQSSLFPLYDRNPQTYVPNIFFAKPSDYRSATVTIEHGTNGASAVLLPIVPSSTAIGP